MQVLGFRGFAALLGVIVCLQFTAGLWHIGDPFIDGSIHYNWGPPFWLMQAQEINEVGLANTYFGLKDYASHPELIGPVIAGWTAAAGYSEASIRILALLLTVLATVILTMAVREYVGSERALMFAAIFAALPLIYMFGKKLDQEALVLVFLGVSLWGLARSQLGRKYGDALLFVGSLGMMLSDWSGAVLAFVLGVICIWQGGIHSVSARKSTVLLYAGAALGLCIFFVQSFLQSGAGNVGAYVGGYYDMWKYRAGLGTVHLTPWVWLVKQYYFVQVNYTIIAFIAGLGGLGLGMWGRFGQDRKRLRELAIAASGVLCAGLVYMVAVPQASAIHIYFQYFLSVPVAIGILFVAIFFAERGWPSNTQMATRLIVLFIVIVLSGVSAYMYTELFKSQYGHASDIKLIQTLRDLPADSVVVAADNDDVVRSWFQTPNIQYYAGRRISTYTFDEGIPTADFMIVRKTVAPEIVTQLEASGLVKSKISDQVKCGVTFCLVPAK